MDGYLPRIADLKPSAILEGPEPRLIDEWQGAPQLWDAVRSAVDRGGKRGRFILTGPSTPSRRGVQRPSHSGVGRVARLTMRTMSLWESRESSGAVSLSALFDAGAEADVSAVVDFDVEDVAFALCRGGWPAAVTEPESMCVRDLRVYASALGGEVFHYRDKSGLEADAVIVLGDGRWAAVEVKMGEGRVDEGTAHLRKIAERVDVEHEGAPSFLMVATAASASYRRQDGVLVVPLAALRP